MSDLTRAASALPLHTAASAFVPFGVVLVQFQVQVPIGSFNSTLETTSGFRFSFTTDQHIGLASKSDGRDRGKEKWPNPFTS